MPQRQLDSIFDHVVGPKHYFALGPLNLFIERQDNDWRVAWMREPDQINRWHREDAFPEGLDLAGLSWIRFASNDEAEVLSVLPCFPARSVVIRPQAPYHIRPSDKISFFMSVPLSIRIALGNRSEDVMIEEPTIVMSKTWFGDPEDGELCFASRTKAVREFSQLEHRKCRVVCPVRMRNISDERLQFERFCLRVQNLNLYAGINRYWSNEVGITYKGPNEISRVAYSPSDPLFEKPVKKVLSAIPQGKELFKLRSFYNGVMGI